MIRGRDEEEERRVQQQHRCRLCRFAPLFAVLPHPPPRVPGDISPPSLSSRPSRARVCATPARICARRNSSASSPSTTILLSKKREPPPPAAQSDHAPEPALVETSARRSRSRRDFVDFLKLSPPLPPVCASSSPAVGLRSAAARATRFPSFSCCARFVVAGT